MTATRLHVLAWTLGLAAGSSAACSGATTRSGAGGAAGTETAAAGSSSGGASSTGAASSTGGAPLGGSSHDTDPDCDTAFDELTRACLGPDGCQLVEHQIDCCGGMRYLGIASAAAASFVAAESHCAAQFPACGCAAQKMSAEDGSLVDFGDMSVIADCIEGRCQSRHVNSVTPCGPLSCNETQYCREVTGGPVGAEPSYDCLGRGDCQTCACMQLSPGCRCTDASGTLKVHCDAQ